MNILAGMAALGAALALAKFRGRSDVCVYQKIGEQEDGLHLGNTAALPIKGTLPMINQPMCITGEDLDAIRRRRGISEDEAIGELIKGVTKQINRSKRVGFSDKVSVYEPFATLKVKTKTKRGSARGKLFIGGTNDPGFRRTDPSKAN